MIKFVFTIIMLITASVIFSCDTTKTQHPYLVLTVHLTPVVDQTHKLYVVFHAAPDWSSPWLTVSSESNTIYIPPLNVGKIPLYMEIIYNTNGGGDATSSGNYYQGWNGKTIRSGAGVQVLDAFIIPQIPVMILNFDLDTHGTL
jgi:hypothetical protein